MLINVTLCALARIWKMKPLPLIISSLITAMKTWDKYWHYVIFSKSH